MSLLAISVLIFVFFLFALILFLASCYKRCPSNKILAIYGKVGEGKSVTCFHGGGTFIWPLIQDSRFLDLTPMTISIPLKGALSFQNIRISVPSTFTIAIDTSTEA
ncbi:MAG TPA: flotillin family protein, partial [Candidatus Omnitrophota bacterium]|nr:flotillin family protein [Candidatus Omnitrophota bacterium]